jgi:phage portal protein BeeE
MDSLDLFDRGPGRPRGAYGDVREALLSAWAAGPAPVRQAADMARVGHAVARYTATRMANEGQLRVVLGAKPAVLALANDTSVCVLPDAAEAPMSTERVRDELHRLGAAFWGGEPMA